ncbi:MAG: DNA polymerase III subunit alpha [Gammaproteobacteria bacterium]|nr:DNA polymerase III subunit alpha [Gammaproteobacteria bacterium]
MSPKFIHLRVHTEFSMVDGIVRHKPLFEYCSDLKMPAIAMTDQGNICGLVKFYRGANAKGIKPIIGVDAWVRSSLMEKDLFRVVFLCQNQQGYKNLTRLISRSYTEGQQRGLPIIHFDWIKDNTEGLIVLSGGREGDVGQSILAGNHEQAAECLGVWKSLFPNRYYLELHRTGRENEESYLHTIVGMAEGSNTPVVATNDVHFIKADDFEAHEARVCINQGRVLDDPRRPRNFSEQQYLKTEEEMCALFSDIPEALENSVEIAKRCTVELELQKNYLPNYPVPEGMTIESFFAAESQAGLEKRLGSLFDTEDKAFSEQRKPYDERLQIELDVINEMGFPGYFLIVADFIHWAKNNGVPVGPGRGSGAGSLIAYSLEITDLDPLEYGLLFERFLNPERISMPDFDVDFCMVGRDRVIDYVAEKYGRDSVSQIITFGTMAAKAVIRDVGRVLGHPYGFVDKVAKLIPFDIGTTLQKAYDQVDTIRERYDKEDEFHDLWDLASKLEGVTRHAGKHAGGVVISPTVLTDFTPLYCDESGDNLVCQFDKDDVEAVGLVKFDFLGLKTLTIIDWALDTINQLKSSQDESVVDISKIPLNDKPSYNVLKKANTTAVFQLESHGMKTLIKQLAPSRFEDIIALVALYRPGPLGSGMVEDFVNRKHGRAQVNYPHPELEECLESTYGVILYQEQVMQIAQILAGYSLGGADMLRRAMGKKKIEVMQEQRATFSEGAEKRGVDSELANQIFDLMEKFAEYGFNKSHSAAYALIAYQTAWLKAHYPAEFMAAVMSADMDHTDKIVTFVDDCYANKLTIIPPDVNRGQYRFTVDEKGQIVYGIGAIKGVGEGAIESIVNERESGPYLNLYDFCNRVDLKKTNRRVLEALIKAGAMDSFGQSRSVLNASLEEAIRCAEQRKRDDALGQNDMFGGPASGADDSLEIQYAKVRDWTEEHQLMCERETLGLFLTGHPINSFLKELKQITNYRLKNLQPSGRNQMVILSGLVIGIRTNRTKSGGHMANLTLDDRSGRLEAIFYTEAYEAFSQLLVKDKILVVEGEVSFDDFTKGLRMVVRQAMDMTGARERFGKGLVLDVEHQKVEGEFAKLLSGSMEPYRDGDCPVKLNYRNSQAKGQLKLPENWCISPTDELLFRLGEIPGCSGVRIKYH